MNKEHVEILLKGFSEWNDWRKVNPEIVPDFSNANLANADLRWTDLRHANFSNANLRNAFLRWAKLNGSEFLKADLYNAKLIGADLSNASLRRANIRKAELMGANLYSTDFSGAKGFETGEVWVESQERSRKGLIVYKTFNSAYPAPSSWEIESGSILEENVNSDRGALNGCGINVGSLDFCEANWAGDIWRCIIRWEWLYMLVIPFATEGGVRCGKLELLEKVEKMK